MSHQTFWCAGGTCPGFPRKALPRGLTVTGLALFGTLPLGDMLGDTLGDVTDTACGDGGPRIGRDSDLCAGARLPAAPAGDGAGARFSKYTLLYYP